LDELISKAPSVEKMIVDTVNFNGSLIVSGITNASNEIEQNFLFVAIKGYSYDGHDFAIEAVKKGASVLVVERPLETSCCQIVIREQKARKALGELSAAFYDFPFAKLKTVGITGTNGKTSVAHMVKSILDNNDMPAEIVGTLQSVRTTPEAHILNRIAYEAIASGKKALVMEVSSIGLALGRVEGIHFDVGAFTNLSHDHLDFHSSMEEYFTAKKSLFYRCDKAVIFQNDAWSSRLIDEISNLDGLEVKTVNHSVATNIVPHLSGTRFKVEEFEISLSWGGIFSIDNAIVAYYIGLSLSIMPEKVARGISSTPPVKGRFEMVRAPTDNTPLVVVDYAHTPDALKAALVSARIITGNKVAVVFGCGGDRDKSKRSEMGKTASELADVIVVTTDNPRNEDPNEIVKQIVADLDPSTYVVELDRAKAIELAVSLTSNQDVVLIAGKGHENYQIFKDNQVEFSDADIAKRVIDGIISSKSPSNSISKTGGIS
jgi:UDP-N-acetylmuramoyl-L-alanyl-D-glutamate--2,6-diaminopimelate ligase